MVGFRRTTGRVRIGSFAAAAVVAVMGAAGASAQDSNIGLLYDKLTTLEAQMSDLTNRVERLEYSVGQLTQRLEALARDVDFRFNELGGSSGSSGAVSPSLTAPQPPGNNGGGNSVGSSDVAAPSQTASLNIPNGEAEQQFQFIRQLLDAGDYPTADASLRRFIEQYPTHPLASSAFFWLGEIYYDQRDYMRAAETYAAGLSNYPQGYKAPDTLLKLALALTELGRASDACAALNQLQTAYPTAPFNIQQRAITARATAGCG